MKKPHILVIITSIFAAFICGFFAGRNLNRAPVQIRTAGTTAVTEAVPAESDVSAIPAIIDINTASTELLQTLPGIGAVLAQRIVDYRTEFGPFQTVGDLTNVEGIGANRLEAILELITVGG